MGYKETDPCLQKVEPGEPIFVLRGQDKLAPDVIRYWLKLAIVHNPQLSGAKIREAEECARAMEHWSTRKYPD